MVALLILAGLAEGFGVASLLPLLETATESGTSSEISRIVADALQGIGLEPTVGILLFLVVLGIAMKAVFNLLAMKQVGYTVSRIATELRLRLISALVEAEWLYFAQRPVGSFSNAVSSEAMRGANAYQNACRLLSSTIQALMYLTLAVLISWQIALLGVVAGAVAFVIFGGLIRVSRAAGRNQTRLSRELISRLTDLLHGIKVIRAMGRERSVQELLAKTARDMNKAKEREVLAYEAVRAMQEPLIVLLLAAMLFLFINVGGEPIAKVLVIGFVFYRLMGRIGLLQSDYQMMAVSESAYWSILDRIETAEAHAERSSGDHAPNELEGGVFYDDVDLGYGESRILSNVHLDIPAGRLTAIAGPSGAGKTTLVDSLLGLLQPTKGTISVGEVPLDSIDLRSWRQRVGYVAQELFLFNATIRENVTLGDPDVADEQVRKALAQAGALGFVEKLPDGLDYPVGERGGALSGGQRQRIALARALARKPLLLVLDEITASLDPTTEADICQTLRELRGSTTIVAISHQPAIVDAADQVVVVREGGVETKDAAATIEPEWA